MKEALLSVGLIATVIILAAVASLVFAGGRPNNSTVTSPSFPGYQEVAIDSNSTLGIDLILAINNSVIKQGQDLQTVEEILNVFPSPNNISIADHFPIAPSYHKCVPGDWTPIDVELYSGFYGMNNVTSAKPITYYRTCPAVFNDSLVSYSYYVFEPGSSNATLYGMTFAGAPGNTGIFSLRYVNQISVYQFTSSFSNNTLPVGRYTLMEEDWWGQVVLLHFEVT